MVSNKSHTMLNRAASKAWLPLNPNLALVFFQSDTCPRYFLNVINTVNHEVTREEMYAVKHFGLPFSPFANPRPTLGLPLTYILPMFGLSLTYP